MFEITRRGIINITKGDTGKIHVDLVYKDGSPYVMKSGDKLTFTAKKDISGETLMRVESTTCDIYLTPTDTKQLVVGIGVYDIQLNTAEGDVFTIIGLKDIKEYNLNVYPEVTL